MMMLMVLMVLVWCMGSEPVYTIHYVRSFRSDLLSENMGCGKSVVYGVYLYPMGAIDALHLYLSSGSFGLGGCSHPNVFFKVFGTEQDYSLLTNPMHVAQQMHSAVQGRTRKVVVDWKGGALPFLSQFVDELQQRSYEVYVKAPASYYCMQSGGRPFLLSMEQVKHFIVEMYGEEGGKYVTYESMFEGSAKCSEYPSLPSLRGMSPGTTFYLEKTMQREEYGYIGGRLEEYLKRANQGSEMYFLDSYERQLIEL